MILSIVLVIFFYVIVSILVARGEFQPRFTAAIAQSIPLSLNNGSRADGTIVFFITAAFKVGHSHNLPMMISTTSPDIVVRPGAYHPSSQSDDLYTTGSAQVSRDANITTSRINYEAMSDYIGIDGLTMDTVPFANMPLTAPGSSEDPSLQNLLPGSAGAVMGLRPGRSTITNTSSWFSHVMFSRRIPSNRFGILLRLPGADDTAGQLVLGDLSQDAIQGDLVITALTNAEPLAVIGSLMINEQTVIGDQQIIFETGLENIIGPRAVVANLFAAVGMQAQEDENGKLRGYFDCRITPNIGFSFPYNVVSGDGTRIFKIETDALGRDTGDGMCLSIIEGSDVLADGASLHDTWVVGHAFMQGKYIDFNMDEESIGIGILKDVGG